MEVDKTEERRQHTVSESVVAKLERCIKLCDLFCEGQSSEHHRWIMDLSDSIECTHTAPMNLTFGYTKPNSRGCHAALPTSTVQLMSLLRDSMLRLRYEEAANYLLMVVKCCRSRMPMILEPALYCCGREIIANLDDNLSKSAVSVFVNQCKSIHTLITPHMVLIDQFLHLVTTAPISEAIECLAGLPKQHTTASESANTAESRLRFKAYRGLARYLQWEAGIVGCTGGQISFSNSVRLEGLAEQALDDLCCINGQPGVWDIFILCQVNLLVHKESIKEAYNLVSQYKSHCTDNPHAYKYLLDFIEEHYPEKSVTKQQLLKEYCGKWPSDKDRVLQYVSTLHTDDPDELLLILEAYFPLLDYNCHRDDMHLWVQFDSLLSSLLERGTNVVVRYLTEEWRSRRKWWSAYHFSMSTGAANTQLRTVKLSTFNKLKSLETRSPCPENV